MAVLIVPRLPLSVFRNRLGLPVSNWPLYRIGWWSKCVGHYITRLRKLRSYAPLEAVRESLSNVLKKKSFKIFWFLQRSFLSIVRKYVWVVIWTLLLKPRQQNSADDSGISIGLAVIANLLQCMNQCEQLVVHVVLYILVAWSLRVSIFCWLLCMSKAL